VLTTNELYSEKNFENQLIFDEVINVWKSGACFFTDHPR